jgi:hypothetical protein
MEHKYTVEYGSKDFENNQSVFTILEESQFTNSCGIKFDVIFYHRSAGYKLAGSAAIWTDEVWGYQYQMDNSTHGRYWKDKETAKDYFDKLTQSK